MDQKKKQQHVLAMLAMILDQSYSTQRDKGSS